MQSRFWIDEYGDLYERHRRSFQSCTFHQNESLQLLQQHAKQSLASYHHNASHLLQVQQLWLGKISQTMQLDATACLIPALRAEQ